MQTSYVGFHKQNCGSKSGTNQPARSQLGIVIVLRNLAQVKNRTLN